MRQKRKTHKPNMVSRGLYEELIVYVLLSAHMSVPSDLPGSCCTTYPSTPADGHRACPWR